MRLFGVLPVLSLLLGVRAYSREPVHHRLDVRATCDLCATVNTVVGLPGSPQVDACLCLSDLPVFLETNEAMIAAASQVGEENAIDTLTSLINDVAPSSGCIYPEHSNPSCINGNPCGFECTDGFKPSPSSDPASCVCSAPSVVCNGMCVAVGVCPSSQAARRKRNWTGSGICKDMGPGWVACGVLGGGPRAWECINSARDLESCGGCMFPLTAYSPIGKDCSALPGVADVACLSGECVVRRCLPGYMLALDSTSCIRKNRISQPHFDDAEDVPVRTYGLEHVPLWRN